MIIYQTTDSDGRCYQVRRAGQSIRLYTDGVFHSQYHPQRLQESSLWDLLWLPVTAKIEVTVYPRILVLGVGGGAVMGKLRRLYPKALLVGVDLNPMHLRIARDFFG
ncbi:MAG TPA: class I SAM-dependent methyltransferase, partial [Cellvibrionaceae bacterium]